MTAALRSRVTTDLISQLVTADPSTGVLRWRVRQPHQFPTHKTIAETEAWNLRYAGAECFKCKRGDGYLSGRIFGITFLAHRIAYAVYHGKIPEMIDHINRVRSDNSKQNLREATPTLNRENSLQNSGLGKSGVRGVFFHIKDKKWIARISASGRPIHLGSYQTIEEAIAARSAAHKVLSNISSVPT